MQSTPNATDYNAKLQTVALKNSVQPPVGLMKAMIPVYTDRNLVGTSSTLTLEIVTLNSVILGANRRKC